MNHPARLSFRSWSQHMVRKLQAPVYDEARTVIACAGMLLFLITLFMWRTLLLPPGHALEGIDIRAAFSGWFEFARQTLSQGHLPLWDPHHANGYPFLHNPQVAFFYPPSWLAILLPRNLGFSLFVIFHLWLAGLGILLFVRFMGGNWLGAILSALTFALSHYFAVRTSAGHLGMIATHAWFPWLLLATAWSLRRATVRSTLLPGLIWALSFFSGHTTSLLYTTVGWFIFLIYLGITTRQWLLLLRQVAAAVTLGLALGAAQLLPTLQFALVSTRAFQPNLAFATSYSLPVERLITLFTPDFLGNPLSRIGYPGPVNYWELTYYAGILPIAGLALSWRRPTPLTAFYCILVATAILLALGQEGFLYELLYHWLPPFRLGRGPARIMFLAIFALCALLGEIVSRWDRLPSEERSADLRRLTPTTICLSLLILAGSLIFVLQDPQRQGIELDNTWLRHFALNGFLTVALFLIGLALLLRFLHLPSHLLKRRNDAAFMLILFVILDSFVFGFRFIDNGSIAPDPLWLEARTMLGETNQRLLQWEPNTFGRKFYIENDATRVGLTSVTGYNPLQFGPNKQLLSLADGPNAKVYDLLAVTHVLAWQPISAEEGLRLISHSEAGYIYQRPSPLPVARLVTGEQVIAADAAALTIMQEPDFDPTHTIILNQDAECLSSGASSDFAHTARILTSRPGYWLVETYSNTPAVLVLSETAFPGWRVTVDGRPVPWYNAYIALRAVCVPAGEHVVEWVFDPWPVKAGIGISAVTLLVAAGMVLVPIFRRRT